MFVKFARYRQIFVEGRNKRVAIPAGAFDIQPTQSHSHVCKEDFTFKLILAGNV